MGYRSDVAYIIRVETPKVKEFVALVRLKGGFIYSALGECDLHYCSEVSDFCFSAEDIKWYGGYEDVDGHNSLLEFIADDYNEYAAYRFIRVGENDDDVETLVGGNSDLDPWEELHIVRHINVPFTYRGGVGDKLTELDSLIGDKQ